MRPSRRAAISGGLAAFMLGVTGVHARAATPLRIATLKFGTVNWLLDTMEAGGIAPGGAAFERRDLASTQALTVALQAGAADIIVSDWLWAMRRRGEGEQLLFAPYSSALGAVMVPAGSSIRTVAELRGRRIGVAGGPLDKSWLLLRAYARETGMGDLATAVEPVYGAPPLLSEQLKLGRIDAVLTYWHFAARLDAAGFRRLIDAREIMRALGVDPPPPLVGFVWREELLRRERETVHGFFAGVGAANGLLRRSDEAWERLRPSMQAENQAEFERLRDYFRAGVPERWAEPEQRASARLFEILAEIGGPELVGPATRFDPALFWSPAA